MNQVVVSELDGTYGRLRTPMMGPDGALFVTTSNGSNDKILRVEPEDGVTELHQPFPVNGMKHRMVQTAGAAASVDSAPRLSRPSLTTASAPSVKCRRTPYPATLSATRWTPPT